MPDSGMLFLSLLSMGVGAILVLAPNTLLTLGAWFNQRLLTLDEWLIRRRHIMSLVAFAGCYAFFKLAVLLPALWR